MSRSEGWTKLVLQTHLTAMLLSTRYGNAVVMTIKNSVSEAALR